MEKFIERICEDQPSCKKAFKEEWGALRFTVGDKIFALLGKNNQNDLIVTLKCAPDKANEYRQEFLSIMPGYYMNNRHWNSILLKNCDVPKPLLKQMIIDSYNLVYKGLSMKQKEQLRTKSLPLNKK
ncbi:MmcQ/YjbR family DNA-binding protein [Salipaludibacillus agaradhaerens]|uniref:MmcQ/YjbR family DNA-binding protein n=1 Tax=Salipaludibacillus agaradhaerens TaxID=76935 RepID=A0A9Q4B2I2_SALAG|nr:MmcQ/YjbR family DNA-binding protein [Salipaludibacillus agaradhaerens]MCR6097147.1 MmcQ/YjbR family DNA-binding protein [Salipaludibacillus agaradhaerens]MCR6113368.1 MmcQ/YjbR family DNA-binding protein [Salipaludibacillus agaradhaerens]